MLYNNLSIHCNDDDKNYEDDDNDADDSNDDVDGRSLIH